MNGSQPAVLVVGGRTTGLMMAAELARHGIPVRIVDASPGIDPHVRANLLHTRTLEVLDTLGLVDEVTEGSFEEHGYRVYANGSLVGPTQQKASAEHLQEVDLDYRKSPLCSERETLDGGPASGTRAPDAPLTIDGAPSRMFELFRSTRHQLFVFVGVGEPAERSAFDTMLAAGRSTAASEDSWIDVHVVTGSDPDVEAHERIRVIRDLAAVR
jgi:hypothetical protein